MENNKCKQCGVDSDRHGTCCGEENAKQTLSYYTSNSFKFIGKVDTNFQYPSIPIVLVDLNGNLLVNDIPIKTEKERMGEMMNNMKVTEQDAEYHTLYCSKETYNALRVPDDKLNDDEKLMGVKEDNLYLVGNVNFKENYFTGGNLNAPIEFEQKLQALMDEYKVYKIDVSIDPDKYMIVKSKERNKNASNS